MCLSQFSPYKEKQGELFVCLKRWDGERKDMRCVCDLLRGWRRTKEALHLFRKLNGGVYSSNINNSFKVEVSGIEEFTKLLQFSKALCKTERIQCLCLCICVCLIRHTGACGDCRLHMCCVFVVCKYVYCAL